MELSLPIALFGGIVAFLSPCFLPVVPVFLSQLLGDSVGVKNYRRHALINTGAFCIGFTTVFIALWGLVGLIGSVLSDYADYLRIAGGLLVILLGLHLSGLVPIRPLNWTFGGARPGSGTPGLGRSLGLGLSFGASWTPCIGPVLAGIIGLASTGPSALWGLVLMLTFSIGLSLPLLALAIGTAAAGNRLNWFRKHQQAIEIISGILLITIGFLMVTDLLAKLPSIITI